MACAEGTTRPSPDDPCPWEADTSCDPCWDDYSDEVKDKSIRMATALLWRLSGRRFGCCCVTLRPCRESCCDPCEGGTYSAFNGSGHLWTPAYIDGEWFNFKCQSCTGPCSCTEVCEVDLPGPVCEVGEVKVDGEVLPASLYRVDNNSQLVRTAVGNSDHPFAVDTADWRDVGGNIIEATGVSLGVQGGKIVIDNATTTPPPPAMPVQWGRVLGNGTSTITVPRRGTRIEFSIGGGKTVQWTNAVLVGGTEFATANPNEAFGPAGPENANIILEFTELSGTFTNDSQFGVGVHDATWSFLDCWPTCQDMNLPDTEAGTWSVSYSIGVHPPFDAAHIVGKLASEFAKACVGDKDCQLPRRVQTLSRNGVNATFVDDGNFLDVGLVGILEVDQWLRSVNPYMLKEHSRVFSIDKMQTQGRRTTWEA